MKKLLFTLSSILILSDLPLYAQTVMGAIFTYDGSGKRIKRHMGLMLPKQQEPQDSLNGDNPINHTFKDDNLFLEAYPNPTYSDLTITNLTWKSSDKALITVVDIQGKNLVMLQSSQAKETISFTTLAPGTYMVRYYLNERSTKIWKIIKL